MRDLGNIAAGQTLNFLFSTNDGSGATIAPTTAGSVCVYQDNNPAQTMAGVTYTPSFDGLVGVNMVSLITTDGFYAAGHDYTVVLSGAVIDGETVNAVLAAFSIAHRYPAPDNTADALLDRANGIETNVTVRQALRIMAAVLAGKVSGANSGLEQFTGLDGATARVQVTTDAVGNRTRVDYAVS
jgi:hypothetical protein